MSFLPEADREYLAFKKFSYEEKTEATKRGLVLLGFAIPEKLYKKTDEGLALVSSADILILIPTGYNSAKLDCFHTFPRLFLADGKEPDRANGNVTFAGTDWQFWSRHLAPADWRAGIDGIETYLQFVRQAVASA